MERKVSVERLYTLGDYQNVKFIDEITGIPQRIALNKDAMNLITYAQLLEVESAHKRYIQLKLEKLPKGKLEDVINDTIGILEEEQSRTWQELLHIIEDRKEGKAIELDLEEADPELAAQANDDEGAK